MKFLFILALLVSCKNNEEEDSYSSAVIIPLDIGYYWTKVDSTFSETTGSLISVDTNSIAITGKKMELINNISTEVFYWSGWNKKTNEFSSLSAIFANIDDGFYLVGFKFGNNKMINPEKQFKYPVKKYDQWNVYTYGIDFDRRDSILKISVFDSALVTCLNTNEEISTKIGNFKTISYFDLYGQYKTYTFVSPGIGIVKTLIFKNNKRIISSTLIDYSLKSNNNILVSNNSNRK